MASQKGIVSLPASGGEAGLNRYLAEIKKFPILSPEEEYMLAKRWREHGDTDAAAKLVNSHLRLVAKIAMGYHATVLFRRETLGDLRRIPLDELRARGQKFGVEPVRSR